MRETVLAHGICNTTRIFDVIAVLLPVGEYVCVLCGRGAGAWCGFVSRLCWWRCGGVAGAAAGAAEWVKWQAVG